MNSTTVANPGTKLTSRAQTAARSEVVLRKDQLHCWNGNRVGMIIEAREGTVWLTQTNDSADVILSSGDEFQVSHPGRLVAQGLGSVARLATRPACT